MELRLNGIAFLKVLSGTLIYIVCSPDFCYFSFSAMAVQREAENYKKNINATINSGVAAVWTGLAIRCPVTSETSVKREHGIFISVMRYFHFLKSVIRA